MINHLPFAYSLGRKFKISSYAGSKVVPFGQKVTTTQLKVLLPLIFSISVISINDAHTYLFFSIDEQ